MTGTKEDIILLISKFYISDLYCLGSSVVERKPEELGVVGSIPTPGTSLPSSLKLPILLRRNIKNLQPPLILFSYCCIPDREASILPLIRYLEKGKSYEIYVFFYCDFHVGFLLFSASCSEDFWSAIDLNRLRGSGEPPLPLMLRGCCSGVFCLVWVEVPPSHGASAD